jgi:hypothetical protein
LAASRTTLTFDGARYDLDQYAATLSVARVWPTGWSLAGSLGLVLDGSLTRGDASHDLGAGALAAITLARQWTSRAWFLNGTASLGASRTTSHPPSAPLTAADARLGVTAGRTFGPLSPYLLARAFGGPVAWSIDGAGVVGTDVHHYQLGAGLTLAVRDVALLVDVSALGEQRLSLGLSLRR